MWNGPIRCDGVQVAPLDTQNKWVIVSPAGNVIYDGCPCCNMAMTSERAAKLVADAYLPDLSLPPEAA